MERQRISSYKRFPHRYFGKIPVTIRKAEAAFGGAQVML
jgi:hypothetical protein